MSPRSIIEALDAAQSDAKSYQTDRTRKDFFNSLANARAAFERIALKNEKGKVTGPPTGCPDFPKELLDLYNSDKHDSEETVRANFVTDMLIKIKYFPQLQTFLSEFAEFAERFRGK